jgi:thymidylate synthase
MSGFLITYAELLKLGKIVNHTSERTLEIEDFQVSFWPYERLSSFNARKLNVSYCVHEFLWYLRGDRYDPTITMHATAWKKLYDIDGGFNSNYGQYIYDSRNSNPQFFWVVEELARSPTSRRACMVLLNRSHLRENNVDVVCTYGLSFRIRDNALNMSVSMRSNDAIWGLTNDAFCFSLIHEHVLLALRDEVYPELVLGTYTHKADSLHVYERHWDMLEKLVSDGYDGYVDLKMPKASCYEELSNLNSLVLGVERTQDVPSSFKLAHWMRGYVNERA